MDDLNNLKSYFQVVDTDIVVCDIHGEYEQKTFGSGIKLRCPKCIEERAIGKERDERRVRNAADKEVAERALAAINGLANIRKRFQNASLDNYIVDSNIPTQVGLKSILTEYEKSLRDDTHDGRNLAIIGNIGTGKTHLASALVNYCTKTLHKPACFMTSTELTRLMHESKSFTAERNQSQTIKALSSCYLLVIDEIGVDVGSDAANLALFDVFNTRYEAMLPTIFTSNLLLDDFVECLGKRIVSRIRENAGIIYACDWEDYRK